MQARLRQRLQHVSIGVRLTVMMAVLLAAAMGAFGAITLTLQREQALDAVKWEAQRLIESLDNTLQVQMLRGDTHLSEAVTRIARARSVESATLTKHRGLVRYSTDSRAVGRRVPLTSPQCSGCHRGGQGGKPVVSRAPRVWIQREQSRISVTMPILNHSTCYDNACHAHAASEPVLGVLELDLPFGPVSRALEHYRQRVLLLIAVLVPLTSLLVLLLTRRWVGRPVARLVRATRAVARGDLTQALEQGEGELGELAQAFNRMEQSLQTSQRQIVASEKLASVGKLAASVAHEINNPLTGILTYAEDLYEESEQDDPRRGDYEVIWTEALRCRAIVRNLLDFARQEQPSLMLLDLGSVLDRTLRLVSRLALFHKVKIERSLDPGLPRVQGDAGQLQQVFLNLLVNAAEVMPDGGSITITSSHDAAANTLRLHFSDTGPGIPEDNLSRIFEPFFSTKGGKSSGLGLAVSWGIIDQHGGVLEVDSRVGSGTTFHVELPLPDETCSET